MKKRTLALILAVVLAFSAGVVGTMAWLKDSTDTITNTFTTGKVDISLYEHVWDDTNKKITEEATSKNGNKYTILPGTTITKDPWVVVNEKSEDAYVGVLVSVDNATSLVALLQAGTYDPATFFGYPSAKSMVDGSETGWQIVAYGYSEGTLKLLFAYTNKNQTVVANKAETTLPSVFSTIKIPTALEQEAMEELEKIKINVTAYAIQSANIEANDAVSTMISSFTELSGLSTEIPAIFS